MNFKDFIPTRLPWGNREEAEYLAALYKLTAQELEKSFDRVFLRRAAIYLPIVYLTFGFPMTAKLLGDLYHNGPAAIKGLIDTAIIAELAYCARYAVSAGLKFGGRLYQDLSIVIDAIKHKNGGNEPPELADHVPFWATKPKLVPAPVVAGPR